MFFIILIILFLGYCYGLSKWFEKAGEKGWKAFVPYLRITTWIKLTGQKKSNILWSFVPVVNLFVYSNLLGETSDSYRRYSFWEHFLATALGWAWLPYIGHKEEEKYHGIGGVKEGETRPKKKWYREWTDAILFALFAAYFIRTFVFEIYMIPTSSMEGTLRVGDFLIVNKMAYGSRIPQTPLFFPLSHHSFPKWLPIIGGTQSYLEWIKLDYQRLPSFTEIERNDMVVFNFPANDTTTKEMDSAYPYYDMIRHKQASGMSEEDARNAINNEYTVISRPVDKRENYIKRCVGIAGDKLEIKSGTLYINDAIAYEPEFLQFRHAATTNGTAITPSEMDYLDITEYNVLPDTINTYEVYTSQDKANTVQALAQVTSVTPYFHNNKEDYDFYQYTYYPHHQDFKYNVDNYGPIIIPSEGMTIPITVENVLLYERCITVYEGNTFEIKNGKAYINGEEATEYTFKMNYYWMMGDNRHRSQDSRFWGFVPEDHIVGKAWLLVGNTNHFDRFFKSIHGNWAP
ncbi:MAG: signal peptidase I [Chitinophagales bacterium]